MGFGFVHHSIAILYHQVPNPSITIRNFSIAVCGVGTLVSSAMPRSLVTAPAAAAAANSIARFESRICPGPGSNQPHASGADDSTRLRTSRTLHLLAHVCRVKQLRIVR
jgi:hypothetical protein